MTLPTITPSQGSDTDLDTPPGSFFVMPKTRTATSTRSATTSSPNTPTIAAIAAELENLRKNLGADVLDCTEPSMVDWILGELDEAASLFGFDPDVVEDAKEFASLSLHVKATVLFAQSRQNAKTFKKKLSDIVLRQKEIQNQLTAVSDTMNDRYLATAAQVQLEPAAQEKLDKIFERHFYDPRVASYQNEDIIDSVLAKAEAGGVWAEDTQLNDLLSDLAKDSIRSKANNAKSAMQKIVVAKENLCLPLDQYSKKMYIDTNVNQDQAQIRALVCRFAHLAKPRERFVYPSTHPFSGRNKSAFWPLVKAMTDQLDSPGAEASGGLLPEQYKLKMIERLQEFDTLYLGLDEEYKKLAKERAARATSHGPLDDLVPLDTVRAQVMDFVHSEEFGWDMESFAVSMPSVRSLADPTGTIIPIAGAGQHSSRAVGRAESGDEMDDDMDIDSPHDPLPSLTARSRTIRPRDEDDDDGGDMGERVAHRARGQGGHSRPKRPRPGTSGA